MLLYQAVYFHRTVRAIDLDLAEVFPPAIAALFGDDSPAERLADYVDLDEYALLHQAARWARGEDVARRRRRHDSRATAGSRDPSPTAGAAILLRRPGWRAEAEVRASYEDGAFPTADVATLGADEPGRVAIDLATVDARMGDAAAARALTIEGRDGALIPLSKAVTAGPGLCPDRPAVQEGRDGLTGVVGGLVAAPW